MATIPLSRGLVALVDDADLSLLDGMRWHAKPRSCNGGFYVCSSSIASVSTCYLHRFLMNPPPGLTVDHINGDGLDNRRSNLRLATKSQNNANRVPTPSLTGFRGVEKRGGLAAHRRPRFRARLFCISGNVCGSWRDAPEEAARDYDRLAFDAFGEFARLNFPNEIGESEAA